MRIKKLLSIALIIILAGCGSMGSNDQSTKLVDSTMDNKALVTDFFKAFSAGEIDSAFSLVSDNAIWWVPGDLPFSGSKSKQEYLQVVGAIQSGFPNGLQLNVTSMIAEGDTVAAEVQSYGEHVNGKKYTNKYHFLIKFEEGKMVSIKEYMDTLHLYQLMQP